MDFEQNKVSQDDLENVSGGTIVETKDGKFVILPSGVKFYDKKEDAEKAEKDYLKDVIKQPILKYGFPQPKLPPLHPIGNPPLYPIGNPLKITKKDNSDNTNK